MSREHRKLEQKALGDGALGSPVRGGLALPSGVGFRGSVLATRAKLNVDHIKPLASGGAPYDKANLRATCERCHWAKTAMENESPNPERDEWRAYLRDML